MSLKTFKNLQAGSVLVFLRQLLSQLVMWNLLGLSKPIHRISGFCSPLSMWVCILVTSPNKTTSSSWLSPQIVCSPEPLVLHQTVSPKPFLNFFHSNFSTWILVTQIYWTLKDVALFCLFLVYVKLICIYLSKTKHIFYSLQLRWFPSVAVLWQMSVDSFYHSLNLFDALQQTGKLLNSTFTQR